jgi:hypothetical protein
MPIYEISIRCDEAVEASDSTTSPAKAEKIFYEYCRRRTRIPSQVICTADGDIMMLYHIDDVYAANRWSISRDLETGLPIKRRYLPSSEELLGRKGTAFGKRMPPIKAPLSVIAKLDEIARQTGRTLNEVRIAAYNSYIEDGDTILMQAFKEEGKC